MSSGTSRRQASLPRCLSPLGSSPPRTSAHPRQTLPGSRSRHQGGSRDVHATTVLLQRRPATAAGGIALVVAFPGELHARAPVALAAVAIHPPLDGDESETAGPVRAELNIAGP